MMLRFFHLIRRLSSAALFVIATLSQAAITFDPTPSSGGSGLTQMELIQDAGNTALSGQYLGVKFTSSVALTNVYARAIVGGTGYTLDATEAQDHFIGDLSTVAKTSYWFINFPPTGSGTFKVEIYVGNPALAGAVLQGTSAVYTVSSANSDNSASANKIVSVAVLPGTIQLGQYFNVVVCYSVNSTARVALQPAIQSSFDPNNLRLGNVVVDAYGSSDCTGAASGTFNNQLLYASVSSNSMKANYTFQTVGTVSVNLSPIVSARSGIYKYNSDFATPPAGVSYTIPTPTNRVKIAKSVNITESSVGTTVIYTLTAINSGSAEVILDDFVDTLPATPANATYVPGSSRLNGATVLSNPVINGQTLTWANPDLSGASASSFKVPAGGSVALSFQATLPSTNGLYTNSAIARINGNIIGSTETLGSTSATASTAIGPPNLTVTKLALTPNVINSVNGTSATYTIAVINSGTTAAGVLLGDQLPSGFTYSSNTTPLLGGGATRTGTLDPTVGSSSPIWGTFTIPGGGAVTVTFSASLAASVADGKYNNSATVTSTTLGATINNFNGATSTADDVTVTSAVLAVTKTTSTPNVTKTAAATSAVYTLTVINSGTAAATGVKVVDILSAGFTYGSSSSVALNGAALSTASFTVSGTSAPQWDTSPAGGFTINPGASNALVITFTAAIAGSVLDGTYDNSAAATGVARSISNFDGNLAANTSDNVLITNQASLQLSKSHAATFVVGSNGVYTLAVTNSGLVPSSGVISIIDTLPSGLTFVSSNNTAIWTCTATGQIVTCSSAAGFVLAAGASSALDLTVAISGGAPNVVNSATVSNANAVLPAAPTLDSTNISTGAATGVAVSGAVYSDVNHNLQKDSGEAGTGLSLFAKLIPATSPAGPAAQAVAVNVVSGLYQFVNVAPGDYIILIDDNSSPSDVVAAAVVAWTGTEMPDLIRLSVVVAATDLQNLNFGLFNGNKVTGRVFIDNGVGGGSANNGVLDGAEAGLAGVAVKLTDSAGSTIYDSVKTDAGGNYSLWIPAALSGTTVKVVETNLPGYVSTGGSVGVPTGLTYDRASGAFSVPYNATTNYTGVNFGDVPLNTLAGNNQQSTTPGGVVFYAHTFTAGTAGSVSFSTTSAAAWPQVLYRDSNCNGLLDSGEAVIGGAITVAANDKLCLILRESIPYGSAINAQDIATLQASFSYTGASPALTANLSNTDITTAGAPTSSGLVLAKTLNNLTPLPGASLVYLIAYTNNSSAALSNIVINDSTVAYTTFVSASCITPLPASLSACNVTTQPAVNGTGSLVWTLSGNLLPGSSGQVTFSVKVDP